MTSVFGWIKVLWIGIKNIGSIHKLGLLKEENEKLRKEFEWKSRYALIQSLCGSFVYALKKSNACGEPAHWLCAKCFEQNVRSFLQRHPKYGAMAYCLNCNNTFVRFGERFVFAEEIDDYAKSQG